ncbi:substrate-binding domain-containing protein [Pontibacter sp. 172403-2]|uniref:LacI family DNA-binding transcriptional regulator n=1 Tax=Pontibacter rufus TaxID=2791028 RepID=UPI0018AF9437|nr:substrate-binding domain-containing protein [Pontibacter sp. 172403-2]MBF9255130.1 substrate-binding domain-containing protein [Pontibacter sp. 172403-2]
MSKKLSIRDIGNQLGVSVTTVSFILNGKAKEKRISESLTRKVLAFVEEVGFKPNSIAQGLRTGKSKIICLMVEDISNVFFAQVARLIEEEAHNKGYRILYCSTENKVEKTRDLIRMFRDRLIDGYIITPPEGVEEDIKLLIDDNIPVILADRFLPALKSSYVVIDNANSTHHAVSHLTAQGFRHVAFVTLDSEQTQMVDRLRGYEQAMEAQGLPVSVLKLNFDDSATQNITRIASYLKAHRETDAVLFGTNYIGIWGLQALKTLNLHIPSDIGVVSFDDHDLFKLHNPPITAIAQPVEEISRQIIRLMLNSLDGSDIGSNIQEIVLPAKLIIRESSELHRNPVSL